MLEDELHLSLCLKLYFTVKGFCNFGAKRLTFFDVARQKIQNDKLFGVRVTPQPAALILF